MRDDKKNLIVELTFDFAVKIVALSEKIRTINRFEMVSQIFRSGTSIGANTREAQNAESKADFIHKFKIAAKAADEVAFWLALCKKSPFYPNPDKGLFSDLNSITLILSKIISSSKERNFQIEQSSNFQIKEIC